MPATAFMRPGVTAVYLGLLLPGGQAATGVDVRDAARPASEVIWQWDGPLPEDPRVMASLRLYYEAGNFTLTAVASRGNCVVNVTVPVVSDQSWPLYQRCDTGVMGIGDVVIEGSYSVSRLQRTGSTISLDFSFSGTVWDEIAVIWPSKSNRGATLGQLGHIWQVSGSFAAPQPAPPPAPTTEPTYQIVAQYSAKCVDVSGVSVESGAAIQQWDCLGSQQRNQVWLLRPARDGLYLLIAQHSNKCMDVEGQSLANGAPVIQWDCLFLQANQLWAVQGLGDGRFRLVASHSSKCLTLSGPTVENGARFLQWDCDAPNQPGQLFALQAIR